MMKIRAGLVSWSSLIADVHLQRGSLVLILKQQQYSVATDTHQSGYRWRRSYNRRSSGGKLTTCKKTREELCLSTAWCWFSRGKLHLREVFDTHKLQEVGMWELRAQRRKNCIHCSPDSWTAISPVFIQLLLIAALEQEIFYGNRISFFHPWWTRGWDNEFGGCDIFILILRHSAAYCSG